MQIYPEKFGDHLDKSLPSVVLVFGDEPQQKLECIDYLRLVAKQQGFEERQSLVADSQFDWNQLVEATQSLSLFSALHYIELELPTGKPGAQGAKVLTELANSGLTDTLLLVHGPKVGKDVQSTKWFKTLDKLGIYTICYALEGARLNQWVERRFVQQGITADPECTALVADFCDGNLLAAKQEIDKLALQYPQQRLTRQQVESSIVDQSRFSVFQLVDKLLAGDIQKAIKILYRLESEGIEPNIVIWALLREWQTLWRLNHYTASNQQPPWQKLRIWPNKQSLYKGALSRLSTHHLLEIQNKLTQADYAFKNAVPTKPFITLCHLCLLFNGAPLEDIPL